MSHNTRNTRKAATQYVTRSEFDTLSENVQAILAHLEAKAAPVAAPKAAKRTTRKATRTTARKATPAPVVETTAKCLTRKTRPAFVKANPQFAGQTTGDIQRALLEGASFEGHWTVGPRTVEFFETGAYPESTPKAGKAAKGKKARKAAKATKVVAEVKPEAKAKAPAKRATEPEYGTEAWIAWARPTDDGAPRRANGTAAPKAEWALRIALEAAGKFDRHEIDKVVAASA